MDSPAEITKWNEEQATKLAVSSSYQNEIQGDEEDRKKTHRSLVKYWDKRNVEKFNRLFGLSSRIQSLSVGRRYFAQGYHPANLVAGRLVSQPLGLSSEDYQELITRSEDIEIPEHGDVVLVGGGTSTPLARVAYEFYGPTDDRLSRPQKPILKLPYYSVSDARLVKDKRVGWVMEKWGHYASYNWGFVKEDYKTGGKTIIRSSTGSETITVDRGGTQEVVPVPLDNYLLVTRLPNFLDTNFGTIMEENLHRDLWPYLTMFDGSNGLGTRAVELLAKDAGVAVLDDIMTGIGGARDFQVLLRVKEIDRTDEGIHKGHSIEVFDDAVVPLTFDDKTYRKAHRYAMRRFYPSPYNRLRQYLSRRLK